MVFNPCRGLSTYAIQLFARTSRQAWTRNLLCVQMGNHGLLLTLGKLKSELTRSWSHWSEYNSAYVALVNNKFNSAVSFSALLLLDRIVFISFKYCPQDQVWTKLTLVIVESWYWMARSTPWSKCTGILLRSIELMANSISSLYFLLSRTPPPQFRPGRPSIAQIVTSWL